MITRKRLFLVMMLTVALLTFAACQSSDSNDVETPSPGVASGSDSDPSMTETAGGESAMSGGVSTVQPASGGQQAGIFVSGTGRVSVSPDTAILSLGVQAQRDTVAEARNEAADAMTAIVEVLRSRGVEENDIRTQSLRIRSVYSYQNETPELVGFSVVNNVRVIIRDLDSIGPIIDSAAEAGGDLTRIDDIYFTVDDSARFQSELREKAVSDATAKAQHLATLAGVTLGPAIAIREGGGVAPISQSTFTDAPTVMEEAMDSETPIGAGQMELSLTISMAFAIQ